MLRLLPKNESKRTANGDITDPAELDNAQQRLFHLVQLESFNTEKKCLLKSSSLSKSSKIVEFSPFIGPNGLLRASGRTGNWMLLPLTQNTQSYLTAVIHWFDCSWKTCMENNATRVSIT